MARLALSRSTRTTSDPGRTASLRYVPKLYSSVLELGFTEAGREVALEKRGWFAMLRDSRVFHYSQRLELEPLRWGRKRTLEGGRDGTLDVKS